MFYITARFRIAIALALAFLLLPLAQVYAADITVDSTCTLTQAINEANEATTGVGSCEAGDDANPSANPPEDGADKIILPAQVASTSSSPRVVTTLSAALPWLASNITIEGRGHVINLKTGTSITVAVGAQVTIKDLTINGGGSFYYPQLWLVDDTTLINVSLVNATYGALKDGNSAATFTLTNVFIGNVNGVFSIPAGLNAFAGTWIITDLLIREIWGGHSSIYVWDGVSVTLQGCFSQDRIIPPAYKSEAVDNSVGSCADHDRDNDGMIGNILDKNAATDFPVAPKGYIGDTDKEACGLPAAGWFSPGRTYSYTLTDDCQQTGILHIPYGAKVIVESTGNTQHKITAAHNNTIFFTGGELTIRNVKLIGKTAATQAYMPIVNAQPLAKLRIEDSTFQRADTASNSVGIFLAGAEATLKRVVFDGLKSNYALISSAVYVEGTGSLQVCDSIFQNNQGGLGAFAEAHGTSSVIMSGNTFENNSPEDTYERPGYPVIERQDECPKPPAAPEAKKRDSGGVGLTIKPTPTAATCLTLAGVTVTPPTGGVQCQRVDAILNGIQGSLDAVDVWGWVLPNTQVCFEAAGGTIKFIDTAPIPRVVADLPAYSLNGMTCAAISGPGIVVLLPGDPPPARARQSAPQQAASQIASRSLSDCMVRTKYMLRFRDAPGGAPLQYSDPWGRRESGWLPATVTLTALARTPDWFKVDYYGVQGWVSARHVTPQGACG